MGRRAAVSAVMLLILLLQVGCGGGSAGGDPVQETEGEGSAAGVARSEDVPSGSQKVSEETAAAEPAPQQPPPEEEPLPEEPPREEPPPQEPEAPPAPEYVRVGDGVGALSLSVPASWGEVIVGAESEVGDKSWSAFAGESLAASVTASPSLDGWSGAIAYPGVYAAVSESLALDYADEDLVVSGPNDLSGACTVGAQEALSRGPYGGVVQEWEGCGGTANGMLTVAAAPEGRACVLVMQMAVPSSAAPFDAADRAALLDGFEVDCAALP